MSVLSLKMLPIFREYVVERVRASMSSVDERFIFSSVSSPNILVYRRKVSGSDHVFAVVQFVRDRYTVQAWTAWSRKGRFPGVATLAKIFRGFLSLPRGTRYHLKAVEGFVWPEMYGFGPSEFDISLDKAAASVSVLEQIAKVPEGAALFQTLKVDPSSGKNRHLVGWAVAGTFGHKPTELDVKEVMEETTAKLLQSMALSVIPCANLIGDDLLSPPPHRE